MAVTIFVLLTEWVYDFRNVEMATIIFEDYELDKIGGIDNLSVSNFPEDLLSSVKKIKEAQDRSIQGRSGIIGLYRVVSKRGDWPVIEGLDNIKNGPNKDYQIGCTIKPICKFDENLNPIPF